MTTDFGDTNQKLIGFAVGLDFGIGESCFRDRTPYSIGMLLRRKAHSYFCSSEEINPQPQTTKDQQEQADNVDDNRHNKKYASLAEKINRGFTEKFHGVIRSTVC